MDCFNCPNQWKCKDVVMDAVIQGKRVCPNAKSEIDSALQSKTWSNGGYLYKAIDDVLKGR